MGIPDFYLYDTDFLLPSSQMLARNGICGKMTAKQLSFVSRKH